MRCYLRDHKREWDEDVQVLTYSYHTGENSSAGLPPIALVPSRTPSGPDIYHAIQESFMKAWKAEDDWEMKIASTVECDKLDLKKAQVKFKRNFDRRLRHGITKISVAEYTFLEVQDRMEKDKIRGHTEGPLLVPDCTTPIFVIKRGEVVERFYSDLVGWVPAPGTKATTCDELKGTKEEFEAKNMERTS